MPEPKENTPQTFNITLTAEERQLISNSARWCLIYKSEVCGGAPLARVQKIWQGICDKLDADGFIE